MYGKAKDLLFRDEGYIIHRCILETDVPGSSVWLPEVYVVKIPRDVSLRNGQFQDDADRAR